MAIREHLIMQLLIVCETMGHKSIVRFYEDKILEIGW